MVNNAVYIGDNFFVNSESFLLLPNKFQLYQLNSKDPHEGYIASGNLQQFSLYDDRSCHTLLAIIKKKRLLCLGAIGLFIDCAPYAPIYKTVSTYHVYRLLTKTGLIDIIYNDQNQFLNYWKQI